MSLSIETANLSPELRRHVHADFLANEQAYLAMRAELILQHAGRWVAIHNGAVVAVADDLPSIMDAVADSPGHPFIACVGREDAATFTVRRVEFPYDLSYQPVPMPRIELDFWNFAETKSQTLGETIPDTGADMSVLPEDDCLRFDLFSGPYFTAVAQGVVGAGTTTLVYRAKAEINRRRVAAFIQPIPGGQERILGRDALNEHRVIFDGPAQRVVFEP